MDTGSFLGVKRLRRGVNHPPPSSKEVNPVTGLEWPRGFQEVKLPRSHDNGTGWW